MFDGSASTAHQSSSDSSWSSCISDQNSLSSRIYHPSCSSEPYPPPALTKATVRRIPLAPTNYRWNHLPTSPTWLSMVKTPISTPASWQSRPTARGRIAGSPRNEGRTQNPNRRAMGQMPPPTRAPPRRASARRGDSASSNVFHPFPTTVEGSADPRTDIASGHGISRITDRPGRMKDVPHQFGGYFRPSNAVAGATFHPVSPQAGPANDVLDTSFHPAIPLPTGGEESTAPYRTSHKVPVLMIRLDADKGIRHMQKTSD